jgi:hypothetical protein
MRVATEDERLHRDAVNHYFAGRINEAIRVASALSARGCACADLLLGAIYEFGSEDVRIDLDRSMRHYQRAARELGDAVVWIRLASTLRKTGDEAGAAQALLEARAYPWRGDHHVAFGLFEQERGDLDSARHHYARGALRGRRAGFVGLACVLRHLGRDNLAFGVDIARLIVGPLARLLLGQGFRYGGPVSSRSVAKRSALLLLVVSVGAWSWPRLWPAQAPDGGATPKVLVALIKDPTARRIEPVRVSVEGRRVYYAQSYISAQDGESVLAFQIEHMRGMGWKQLRTIGQRRAPVSVFCRGQVSAEFRAQPADHGSVVDIVISSPIDSQGATASQLEC